MIDGNTIGKGFARTLLLVGFVLFFLSGCVPNNQYQTTAKTQKTGLYNITGWNSAHCYFPGKKLGNCTAKDIDGKVGYQLYVGGLRANCKPGDSWTISKKIITSGSLPPGLSFDGWKSVIKGIPEKRGHWIVRLKVDHLYCNDISYYGVEQELRFHITGSGKVRQ